MIITPHLVVGATIGAKTHNLGLIIILGLLSHFVLDRIPHWDYSAPKNLKLFKETKGIKYLFISLLQMTIDWVIGLVIVFICILNKDMLNWNSVIFIILGIFVSTLPDIILVLCLISEKKSFCAKYIKFHCSFHFKEKSKKEGKLTFLGLATQIIIVILSLFVFFS